MDVTFEWRLAGPGSAGGGGEGGVKRREFMKQKTTTTKKAQNQLCWLGNNKTNKAQASRFCSTPSHYCKTKEIIFARGGGGDNWEKL